MSFNTEDEMKEINSNCLNLIIVVMLLIIFHIPS